MSDGRIFKPEKDFSKEAAKQISEAQELANVTLLVYRVVKCNLLTDWRLRAIFKKQSRNFQYLRNLRAKSAITPGARVFHS